MSQEQTKSTAIGDCHHLFKLCFFLVQITLSSGCVQKIKKIVCTVGIDCIFFQDHVYPVRMCHAQEDVLQRGTAGYSTGFVRIAGYYARI